ncbi:MAG: alpha/beta hydrolase-fold protein [Pseudomonadota bacterium]
MHNILAASLLLAFAAPALACGPDSPCVIESGEYMVSLPSAWDGTSPIPAAIYFHGWQSTAEAAMANKKLRQAFDEIGVLLIVPQGAEKTWSHVGSPTQARDEIAFIDQLLADVENRFPIDPTSFWVTGFSQGGSMAWDVACYRGDRFAAFAPIAGAFWEDLPETCPAGPVNLRHVHGFTDNVVPLEGRAIRQWHQGDVFAGFGILREINGCRANPVSFDMDDGLRCRSWEGCSSGKELELCLHDGGHMAPDGWVEDAWSWVQSVAG